MTRSRSIPLALALCACALAVVLVGCGHASAAGISVAPLKYQTNLDGKIKKGVVDISNHSGYAQNVTIQVRAFRQVDNKGTLQFYDDPLVSAGVIPDLTHFKLGPQQTEQLYFQLNGESLPKKRVFAALFAEAQPVKQGYSITPVLRVGTLLILKNGNGDPPKHGRISNWDVSLFQVGHGVNGKFDFKNDEKGQSASGYFPNFRVSMAGQTKKFKGDLVFPGIKREQQFSFPGSRIGIYKIRLTSDAKAGAEQWVVVITGYWRWLSPLIVVLVASIIYAAFKFGNRYTRRKHHKRSSR